MKILKQAKMPDGTYIQIEDWREDYPWSQKTLTIAAYPLAKRQGRYGFVRINEKFRLELSRGFSRNREVMLIFKSLQNGEITLEDLHEHYCHGDKDRYYMGLREEELWDEDL